MGVSSLIENDGKLLTISVNGKFDFGCHQQFRLQYEELMGSDIIFVVDLQGTSYMDSSALGMLLLLRDHSGGDSGTVRIINANNDIQKILQISNFHQLFSID